MSILMDMEDRILMPPPSNPPPWRSRLPKNYRKHALKLEKDVIKAVKKISGSLIDTLICMESIEDLDKPSWFDFRGLIPTYKPGISDCNCSAGPSSSKSNSCNTQKEPVRPTIVDYNQNDQIDADEEMADIDSPINKDSIPEKIETSK